MRISDWSSDVCSSDLGSRVAVFGCGGIGASIIQGARIAGAREIFAVDIVDSKLEQAKGFGATTTIDSSKTNPVSAIRSEEHTSELQSLMRISYAVFCLKKKKTNIILTRLI